MIEQFRFSQKAIFTMEEAALFTGLSKSTIYKMTMLRTIPFSKPGGKIIYFRKADLEEYMLGNLHKSESQLQQESETELITQKMKGHERI